MTELLLRICAVYFTYDNHTTTPSVTIDVLRDSLAVHTCTVSVQSLDTLPTLALLTSNLIAAVVCYLGMQGHYYLIGKVLCQRCYAYFSKKSQLLRLKGSKFDKDEEYVINTSVLGYTHKQSKYTSISFGN